MSGGVQVITRHVSYGKLVSDKSATFSFVVHEGGETLVVTTSGTVSSFGSVKMILGGLISEQKVDKTHTFSLAKDLQSGSYDMTLVYTSPDVSDYVNYDVSLKTETLLTQQEGRQQSNDLCKVIFPFLLLLIIILTAFSL